MSNWCRRRCRTGAEGDVERGPNEKGQAKDKQVNRLQKPCGLLSRLPLGSALRFSRQGDGHTPRIAGRGGAKVHASAPLQRGPDARASPRFSARGGAFRALNPAGCCKGFDGPERKTEGKGAFFSRNGRFRERIFGVRFVAFAPKKRGAKRTECAEMRRPRLHKPAQWLLADVLRMSGGCPADAARGIAGSIQAALQAAYRRHTGRIRGVYGAYYETMQCVCELSTMGGKHGQRRIFHALLLRKTYHPVKVDSAKEKPPRALVTLAGALHEGRRDPQRNLGVL